MPSFKQHIVGLLSLLASLWLVTGMAWAEEEAPGYLPQFRLQLDQQTRDSWLNYPSSNRQDLLQPRLHSFDPAPALADSGRTLQQYDARLFYPVSTLHGMSLDLGVNIKYLNAVSQTPREEGVIGVHNFNQAIPMVYATALFDLPFDGLSASLEGSHRDTTAARAFDYRAKLQYRWNNGLGLQGGWQHQQYSLDNGQDYPALEYESKGVFLDLFMDF